MYCITLFSFEPRWYEIPPILYVHGTPKWKDVWYETMASRGVSNLQPAAWDALFCQNWLLKDTIGSKNGYGSIPINTIFSGMKIHLPAILMFTRGTRFWHTTTCPSSKKPVFSLASIRKREVLKCISYASSSNKSAPKQGYREIQRGWSCLTPLKDLRTDCHIIWHAWFFQIF